jgi:cathepsin L
MDNAFKYIKANGGIDTEAGYPYKGVQQKKCKFTQANVGATDTVNINRFIENSNLFKYMILIF